MDDVLNRMVYTLPAVPVKHFNGRYGFDMRCWIMIPTQVYVIVYQGITVFFAGDTGYDPVIFKEIGKSSPSI